MNNRIHPDEGELTIRLLDTPEVSEKQATVLFGGISAPGGIMSRKYSVAPLSSRNA